MCCSSYYHNQYIVYTYGYQVLTGKVRKDVRRKFLLLSNLD